MPAPAPCFVARDATCAPGRCTPSPACGRGRGGEGDRRRATVREGWIVPSELSGGHAAVGAQRRGAFQFGAGALSRRVPHLASPAAAVLAPGDARQATRASRSANCASTIAQIAATISNSVAASWSCRHAEIPNEVRQSAHERACRARWQQPRSGRVLRRDADRTSDQPAAYAIPSGGQVPPS